MKDLKLKVSQGIIHINSIRVLQYTNEVILLSLDFKQKYSAYSGRGDKLKFFFGSDEETLYVENANAELTEVEILNDEFDEADFHIHIRMGRYSAEIFIVRERPSSDEDIIWWDAMIWFLIYIH